MKECTFVYHDEYATLQSRIQIMSITEAENLEKQGLGVILNDDKIVRTKSKTKEG